MSDLSKRWNMNRFSFVSLVSLAKVDGGTVTKCNFAGDEKAGASWTDKIMANKADGGSAQKSGGEGEGADEDEWVRSLYNRRYLMTLSIHSGSSPDS